MEKLTNENNENPKHELVQRAEVLFEKALLEYHMTNTIVSHLVNNLAQSVNPDVIELVLEDTEENEHLNMIKKSMGMLERYFQIKKEYPEIINAIKNDDPEYSKYFEGITKQDHKTQSEIILDKIEEIIALEK
jgi:hypothetical protein